VPAVTRLEPAGRRGDRFRVYVDGDPLCTLSRKTVDRLGLAEGVEISPEAGEALRDEAVAEDALRRALRYLSYRSRTRSEIVRYLERRGYGSAVVAATLERCEAQGYVDDRAFAASWTRDRIRLKPRGVAKLRGELRQRGITPADADAGIRKAFEEEGVSERDLVERAALRRWRIRRSNDPPTVRRRLSAYLRRRGFPAPDIRDVVDRLMGEMEP
jgi:regulatory protein